MKTVFKIRRYTEREVDSLISLMTANGYKVRFEKGDRVTTKVIISKDGNRRISRRRYAESAEYRPIVFGNSKPAQDGWMDMSSLWQRIVTIFDDVPM